MIGILDNKVDNVKFIGSRETNMEENMKRLSYERDEYWGNPRYKPYFNDAKELF